MADMLDRQINSYISKLRSIKSIEVPRASAKALNTVGNRSVRRIVRGISKQTRFSQKALKKRTFIRRATSKNQSVRLTGYASPVSAIHLLTKNQRTNRLGRGTNKTGVRAKGYNWPGAFIARGLNENIHVFKRTGISHRPRKGNYAGQSRDEIDSIKVPVNKQFRQAMKVVPRRVMKSDYHQLLLHELKFRLRKYVVR